MEIKKFEELELLVTELKKAKLSFDITQVEKYPNNEGDLRIIFKKQDGK